MSKSARQARSISDRSWSTQTIGGSQLSALSQQMHVSLGGGVICHETARLTPSEGLRNADLELAPERIESPQVCQWLGIQRDMNEGSLSTASTQELNVSFHGDSCRRHLVRTKGSYLTFARHNLPVRPSPIQPFYGRTSSKKLQQIVSTTRSARRERPERFGFLAGVNYLCG